MKHHLCNANGGVVVIVASALAAMIGLTALVVDGGFGLITRNELHNIADAASLAGARKLGKIYEALSPSQQQTYTLTSTDRAAIIAYMNNVSTQNQAGGLPIPIPDDSAVVQIGHWDGTTFTQRNAHPDAVHVTGRRDGTSAGNGPLATILAPVFGVSQMSVSVSSTAALTGVKQVPAGQLNCPVGIPKGYAASGSGCTNLVFSGTGACAGWHTYFDHPASVARLKTILDGIRLGTYPIPAAKVGDQFYYNGGQLQSAFSNFQNLYNAKKNPATGEWSTTIVVYDIDSCSTNPTGPISIFGFVSATITGIASGNLINARVNCNVIDPGPGGGGTVGDLGSIPSLVQ
jgi:Putative Flp pilus-assembly TadE/G-like